MPGSTRVRMDIRFVASVSLMTKIKALRQSTHSNSDFSTYSCVPNFCPPSTCRCFVLNEAGLVVYDRDVTYTNDPNAPNKAIINHVMKSHPDIGNSLYANRFTTVALCINITGIDGEPQLHKYWKVCVYI